MEIARFAELRPRTVWDILDDAFDLYRERFVLLAGVSAVAYVPALLTILTIGAGPFDRFLREFVKSLGPHDANTSDASGTAMLQMMGVTFIGVVLLFIAQTMQTGATCIVVEDRLSGVTTTILSSWRRMLLRVPALLVVSLLTGVAGVLISSFTSGLGEIFFAPVIAYLPQAILLERQGLRGAFRRSSVLSSYGYGKSLGLVLLWRVLGTFLGFGLLTILLLALTLLPGGGQDALANTGRTFTLAVFALGVTVLLLAPLIGIATTLLYYDLRVRREGIDIEAAAVEIGYPIAADYFGGIDRNPNPRAVGQGGRGR